MSKKPSIFYFWLVVLYFTICVVNWLPLIDNSLVRIIKYGIFLIIFSYECVQFGISFPSSFLSPRGLLIILASMLPGLFLSFNLNALIDILVPFMTIWVFNFKRSFYYFALMRSVYLVAFISVFHIFSNFFGVFDMVANGPWNTTFSQSAFGGYRTGYSNSLFLYIPFLIFAHRDGNKNLLSVESFVILLIIVAQFISGGRAGLATSLVVLLIWFKIPSIFKLVLTFYILLVFQLDYVQEQLRITDLDTTEENFDAISSGRLFLNNYYFDKFLEEPYFGYGFGEKLMMITRVEAHIVWLRNLINGGLFYTLTLIYLFIEIFRRVRSNVSLSLNERKLFNSLFYSSLIITFLEPNYLIGSAQGEMVYWFLISILLKKHVQS